MPQPLQRHIHLTAVITAYNRADFVGICCQALIDSAAPDLAIKVIVMDNGSTDNTKAVAEAVDPRVTVSRTEDNRWVVGVINRGIELALPEAPDYILVLNDDTQFLPGALRHLLEVAEAHPHAVLTPLQLAYHHPGHLDANVLQRVQRTHALVEDAVLGKPLQDAYSQRTIIGAAILASTATWKHLGLLDELFWFTGSDDDLCNRAHWLGYEVLLVPGSRMNHAHGGLQPITGPAPKAGILRRYRLGFQARLMFQFKDPAYPFALCVVKASAYALGSFSVCAARLWLSGAKEVFGVYLHAMARLPEIAAARKAHYDPAKKVAR